MWLPLTTKFSSFRTTVVNLTRLPSQTTSSRWQVDKEAICLSRVQQFSHLCVARPLSILFLNIFTSLALTQSFGSLFHSFITLCEKEYFSDHLTNLSRSSCKLCLSVSLVTFLDTFVPSANLSTLLDMSSSKSFIYIYIY